MQPQAKIVCSFCTQAFEPESFHDCAHKVYTVLNALAQEKKETPNLFNGIENLVFQGGGVKGVSYLGVLQQIQKEDQNLLHNIKRVAGTSAGSMLSLYLGLNMDPQKEIEQLLSTDYSELLDDAVVLRVAINIKDWFGDYKYLNYKARDIVLAAIAHLAALQKEIEANPDAPEAQQKIEEMFEDILRYYGCKFGSAYSSLMRIVADDIADGASKWLFGMLKPQPKPKVRTNGQEQVLSTSALRNVNAPTVFENALQKGFNKAVNNVQNENEERKVNLNATATEAPKQAGHNGSVDIWQHTADEDKPKGTYVEYSTASRDRGIKEIREDDIKFYLCQKDQRLKFADKCDLEQCERLHYALAELLWFCLLSQQDANGLKREIGLFSGSIVREKLIDGAIKMRFDNLGRSKDYKPDLTFKEIAEFKDADGKPLFKQFYMTAFNSATYRTEVFSAEHTPNVIVADAVRASMSIPVFFAPVTIREKSGPRKIYYADPKDPGTIQSEDIHYMDGGILDNYPIWIFDDLKYCVTDIQGWVPKRKIFIHNPKTLGFKLLPRDRIDIYLQPYFDENLTKMKRISTDNYSGSFFNVIGTMLSGQVNENEENQHIYRRDGPRTGYVDNLGVSAIAFTLSKEEKQALIDSGKDAVTEYIHRAKTTYFINEGERYI